MNDRLLLILVSTCMTGCVVEADDHYHTLGVTGTAIVDWTIAGSKDPAECRLSSVASIDIVVDTVGGAFAGEYLQDCDYFATSIELAPGDYRASAVLLDARGVERTTWLDIAPFSIFGNDTLTLPIDFPDDSFF